MKKCAIHWKAVEQYFTFVLFVFQCYPVCHFGKCINFGLGTVVESIVGAVDMHRLCDPGSISVLRVSYGLSLLLVVSLL